ncbi:MAG: hypothetical protein HKP57_00055 [Halobacteria archaeon]|nr:hypothetical protein [Halobacteria archaeon]
MNTPHNHTGGSISRNKWKLVCWVLSVFVLYSGVTVASYSNPARNYTLFEVDPVRPVAVLARSGLVAALNVPDDHLELFRPHPKGAKHCGSIKVGMRPVAVAVVKERRHKAELWVVNHLSDSISVVRVHTRKCHGEVIRTVRVGDEPRDIVVAKTPAGNRVLVTTAHRGQNHPDPETAGIADLTASAAEKALLQRPTGMADVLVFDPQEAELLQIINLFSDTPRALALGPVNESGYHTSVYAAGFHTGNRTTVVAGETARAVGLERLIELLEHGEIVATPNGELVVKHPGSVEMHGGVPAVLGQGRCSPDPRPERMRRHTLQLCAQTDADNKLLALISQQNGEVSDTCACTSSDGTLQPVTGLIVRFFADPEVCGEDYSLQLQGCWLDRDPAEMIPGDSTVPPPMEWNDWVKFSLPDEDVFQIPLDAQGGFGAVTAYPEVGTILFSMVTHPANGKVYVANQEANNITRFEGHANFATTTVRGDLIRSRITLIDNGQTEFKDLNDHLDHASGMGDSQRSLAFPVALAMTRQQDKRGQIKAEQRLFFAALGSDKLGYVNTLDLERSDEGEVNAAIGYLNLSRHDEIYGQEIAGPVGLAIDDKRQRIYVLARFTNELLVVDGRSEQPSLMARLAMHSPEPDGITQGRSVMYYAAEMSRLGDQSCASCHVYANFDSIAWDLGNPDAPDVNNPGPYVSPPQLGYVADLAADPEGLSPYRAVLPEDFRAVKGPMATQALRGLDNHGPLHWRGDRVRRVQTEIGQQPNTGTLDEFNSLLEFDEAVTGLTGNDQLLPQEKMDALADFILQISYPPNPIRSLDNSLTPEQLAGRAAYFGCSAVTDEQLEQRVCDDVDGLEVAIDSATRECECFGNPIRFVMHRLLAVQSVALAFANVSISLDSNLDPDGSLRSLLQQQLDDLAPLAQEVAALQRQPLAGLARAGNIAADTALAQVFTAEQLDSIQALVAGSNYPAEAGGLLAFVTRVQALENDLGVSIWAEILAQLDFSGLSHDELLAMSDPVALSEHLLQFHGDANVSRTPLLDALEPSGFEQDPLQGCRLEIEQSQCRLRIADSLTTCQGCHVLDPYANAEFDVAFPGFYGTNGEYAFSNIPQVFKVPHLRNMYAKVGKFGQPHDPDMFVGQSVFGPRAGGFITRKTPNSGSSVRGYGFSHDGSADTAHRFLGLLDFLRRPAGFLGGNDVRGNPDAFDAFEPEDPYACLQSVEVGKHAFFGALNTDPQLLLPSVLAAIEGDQEAAQDVVSTVLSSPAPMSDVRWNAIVSPAMEAIQQGQPVTARLGAQIVEAVAASLLCPDVPDPALMPLCFQLGSTLEYGVQDGICYPSGLLERKAAEAFVLAFDSNLKPMVGQQLTLRTDDDDSDDLVTMLGAAADGHCDIGITAGRHGYLLELANAQDPEDSVLLGDRQQYLSLGELLDDVDGPVTFTCYPPQPGQAEARRSVIDRDADGILNGLERPRHRHRKRNDRPCDQGCRQITDS